MDGFLRTGWTLSPEYATVEYMDYTYPEYPQLRSPFDPHLSIVDLLFMVGPEAHSFIWDAKAGSQNSS